MGPEHGHRHGIPNAQRLSEQPGKKDARLKAGQAAFEDDVPSGDPTGPPTVVTGDEDSERDAGRGVLRLLEAGHFRGVADIRLRINFFDELSANAMATAYEEVQEQAGGLLAAVNTELDQLLDALAVDEQTRATADALRGEFEAAVQGAIEQSTADGALDRNALADALRSAFDSLVDQIRQALSAPPAETEPLPGDQGPDATDPTSDNTETQPTDTPPQEPPETSGDGASDAAVILDDGLARLADTFAESLAGLLTAVESALQLPDLSPPSGRGVAYDKFLAIYNELRGIESHVEGPPSDDATDVTA
jgi:hypothetical protein